MISLLAVYVNIYLTLKITLFDLLVACVYIYIYIYNLSTPARFCWINVRLKNGADSDFRFHWCY
jgi:hypothetical protein